DVGGGNSGGDSSRPSLVSQAAINVVAASPARATNAVVTYRGGLCIVEERTDSLSPVSERLTLLSVHAHPDDEASKGAPTVAKYHAAGVHTVLVCCTGGEEGELQNPSLRAEGQPFHGLT